MSFRTGCVKFKDAVSIERYLEQRCGQPLKYLKERGVLRLVAKDFENQSISTIHGDLPFNNKLVLILTHPDSGLKMKPDVIARSIMPILTTYLKEYDPTKEVEQPQNQNNQISDQNGSRNYFNVALAVIGIAIAIFAASKFGSQS